jgi:hypothetical protein
VDLTEALAEKIYSLYRADFDAFAYDKNEWAARPTNGDQWRHDSMVPEEVFDDEIVERNVILYHLYQERDRLKSQTPAGIGRRFYGRFRRILSTVGEKRA